MNRFLAVFLLLAPAAAAHDSLDGAGLQARAILGEVRRTPVPDGGAVILQDPYRGVFSLAPGAGAARSTFNDGKLIQLRFPMGRQIEIRLPAFAQAKSLPDRIEIAGPAGGEVSIAVPDGGVLIVDARHGREARVQDRQGRVLIHVKLPAGSRARVDHSSPSASR